MRNSMRNSQSFKNDLAKSVSRFSKLPGEHFKSNLRQSLLQSRFEQIHSTSNNEPSGDNFLKINSSVDTGSVIAFNE